MLQETSDEFDPHLPPDFASDDVALDGLFLRKNVNKHVKSILCIVSPTVQTKKSPGPKRHLGLKKTREGLGVVIVLLRLKTWMV